MILECIDISRGKAICLEHTIPSGTIYIVDKDNYDRVLARLIEDLKKFEKT